MKPTPPRLDQHGFPIPPGFHEAGVDDPSGRSPRDWRWLLPLLKVGVVVGVLTALAFHFDVPSKARNIFGEYHLRRAATFYHRGDFDRALAEADRAVAWKPDSVQFLVVRAHVKSRRKDWDGVLADANEAIRFKPNDDDAQSLRASALHFLHRHEDAAAAATDMLQRGLGKRDNALNTRAYARALGNFELKEALADVDEALVDEPDNAMYLDTRGYVLFRLGEYKKALADLDRAIAQVEKQRDELERQPPAQQGDPEANDFVARQLAMFEEHLAVMHYHRGDVHEKLGDAAAAKKDRFIGTELGYNPATGVY